MQVVGQFDEDVLGKVMQGLEKCIISGVSDPSAEVRKNMRAVYAVFRKRFGESAEGLLKRMEPSAVKAIQEQNKADISNISLICQPRPDSSP